MSMALSMRSTELAYQAYLTMVGQRSGLTIGFADCDTACTNGESVFIPERCLKTEEGRNLITGYVLHEAGHCRFSAKLHGNAFRHRLERDMLNCIEDVRIESEMCHIYRGAREIFENLFKGVFGTLSDTEIEKSLVGNPMRVFLNLVLIGSGEFSYAGSRRVTSYAQRLKDAVNGISPSLGDEAMGILSGIPQLTSTSDALSMAKSLYDLFLKHFGKGEKSGAEPKKEEEGKEEQGNPQSEGNLGNTGKAPNSKTERSNEQSVEKGDEASASRLESMTCDYESGSMDAELPLTQKFDLGAQLGVSEITEKRSEKLSNSSYGTTGTGSRNRRPENARRIGRIRLEGAKREANGLTRALRSFIETTDETDTEIASHGRRVDANKLYRIREGSLKVFRRTSENPEGSNTAVTLLLDVSGSMAGVIEEAVKAALSLRLALTNFAAGAAGTDTTSSSMWVFSGIPAGARVRKVVGHNEPIGPAQIEAIGAIDAYGSTPTEEALKVGAIELLTQIRANRKVMFLITDGCCHARPNVLEEIRKEGIEVYGFAIGDMVAEDLKNVLGEANCVEIHEGSMAKALFDLARRIFG